MDKYHDEENENYKFTEMKFVELIHNLLILHQSRIYINNMEEEHLRTIEHIDLISYAKKQLAK